MLLIAVVVLAGLAGVGYRLLSHRAPGSHSGGTSATASRPLSADATVQAYFAAINSHDYFKAWKLNQDTAGETLTTFEAGFTGTAHDSLEILGTTKSGVVTARLTAKQTDGTVKRYEGTYKVADGVIVHTDVHLVR